MPIKVTSNNDGAWITWATPDEGVSTTFRIKKTDPDEVVLEKLVKLTRFIGSQMGELATEIAELEMEILGTAPTAPDLQPAQAAPVPAPPDAPRIPMMSPASLSDAPAGGAPVETFGWSSYPTTTVPEHLASATGGGWEMIPEGER